jgi:signal transduction histidine kinase
MLRRDPPRGIGVRPGSSRGVHRSSPSALARRKRGCQDRAIDRRRLAVAALAAPTAALVVVSVIQASSHSELAAGGSGPSALAVQLAAGLALVAAALDTTRRGELALAGALLTAAAALGLHALPTPADGALLFTLAVIGAGLAPAAAAHAALLHPGGRTAGPLDRAAARSGYVVYLAVLGLLPALVFDPRRSGCFTCPDNLLLVHADPAVADWLGAWGPRIAAVAAVVLAALVLRRLVRRLAAARELAAPVSLAAAVVLALSAVTNLRAADELAADGTDRALWLLTAAALGLLALGIAWRPLRAARVRAALALLTVASPASAEDVRAVLARALGDPSVTIVLPDPETGLPLAPADRSAPAGRARTTVERRGRVVAWIEHRATLDAASVLPATLARAAGLTLERDALRAARRRQEHELCASTPRLIAAGDAERRRLERDLHDGAQQRLLALGVALARARLSAAPAEQEALAAAANKLAALSDHLRSVAHGIHSVTLAEGGLAEAVLALVDASGGGVTVDALPERRSSPEAEAAVYRLVATSLRHATPNGVRLAIRTPDGELRAAIEMPGATPGALADELTHAEARVAALGGSLTVNGENGGAVVRVHVPPTT